MNEADLTSLLWDRSEIQTLLVRYARALDTKDWELYRRCLTDEVRIDFKPLTGVGEVRASFDSVSKWAQMFFAPIKTQHVYTNFDIAVEGDVAQAVVYLTARVWRHNALGLVTSGEFGYYNFSLIRDAGSWRINGIKINFFWVDGSGSVADVRDPEFLAAMGEVFAAENLVLAS